MTENSQVLNCNLSLNWQIALSIVFALAQAIAPFLSSLTGTGTPIGEQPENDTRVTPAGYAFIIWAIIFPSIIAYSVYQAFPENSTSRLLIDVRGYLLFAFIACTLWSIAAQYFSLGLTVVFMFGILAGLIGALIQIIKYDGDLTSGERFFVVFPVGIYAAWITVAAIANTSSWLKTQGFSDVIFTDQTWALIMLGAAAVIAVFVIIASGANTAYALTIVWALVGVAAANVTRPMPNATVAFFAAAAALVVFISWLVVFRSAKPPGGLS